MVRICIWIIAALIFIPPWSSYGEEQKAVVLAGTLNALLPRDAAWALEVIAMDTGKTIISMGNAKDKPLTPGSLVKLVTTGAVLDYASKNNSLDMTTRILYDGGISNGVVTGNVCLVGRGNGLLTTRDIEAAVQSIAGRGVTKISGDIIADDTAFDAKGLERTRKGTGYAPPSALGMDLHTAAVQVLPTNPGKPPEIRMEPPNDEVRLAISARTLSVMRGNVEITQIGDTSYSITGNIPEDSGKVKKRFSLQDPALYAAGTLKTLLNKAGISIGGRVSKGKAPEQATILADMRAQELDGLLRDMNVNSLNVVADNLLLLLGGAAYGFPGTLGKGSRAVNEFLSRLGFAPDEYVIGDGSGLSSDNAVSAKFLARYLQKVSKQPWSRVFRESLPRAGTEGTLRNIGFTDPRFRAKTGKLENAFGLAGYGTDRSGREIVFSYMVNVNAADVRGLEKSGAEIMRYLATEGVL